MFLRHRPYDILLVFIYINYQYDGNFNLVSIYTDPTYCAIVLVKLRLLLQVAIKVCTRIFRALALPLAAF